MKSDDCPKCGLSYYPSDYHIDGARIGGLPGIKYDCCRSCGHIEPITHRIRRMIMIPKLCDACHMPIEDDQGNNIPCVYPCPDSSETPEEMASDYRREWEDDNGTILD